MVYLVVCRKNVLGIYSTEEQARAAIGRISEAFREQGNQDYANPDDYMIYHRILDRFVLYAYTKNERGHFLLPTVEDTAEFHLVHCQFLDDSFDTSFPETTFIGVFSSRENAEDAIRLSVDWFTEKDGKRGAEDCALNYVIFSRPLNKDLIHDRIERWDGTE